MSVIIKLVCDECSLPSTDIEGRAIDTYTYHDAPDDGLDFSMPIKWAMNLDPFGDGPGYVLCPEHAHQAFAREKASADAWRDRVNGGRRR